MGDGCKSIDPNAPEKFIIAIVLQPIAIPATISSPEQARLLFDPTVPKDILIGIGQQLMTPNIDICRKLTHTILKNKNSDISDEVTETVQKDNDSSDSNSEKDADLVLSKLRKGCRFVKKIRTKKEFDSESSCSKQGYDSADSSSKIYDNVNPNSEKLEYHPIKRYSIKDQIEYEMERIHKQRIERSPDSRQIVTYRDPCVEKPAAIIRDRSCPFDPNEKIPLQASCFGGEKPDLPIKLITLLNDY